MVGNPFLSSDHQTSTKRMYFVVVLLVGIVLFLIALDHVRSEILNSIRAFVAGESLWSKSQKDAVHYLNRYAKSHDEVDYEAFTNAISLPLGDMRARIELEKPHPDLELVYEAFLAGGNHPDDVKDLAEFFTRYRHVSYMAKAIGIWSEGDRQIGVLCVLADRLHGSMASGGLSDSHSDLERQLDRVNRDLTRLEKEFSATLGEAARWVNRVTRRLTYLSAAFLLTAGVVCSLWMIRRIRASGLALIDSEARFRRVVESNIVGIFFWQEDGQIHDANDAFLQMIGYSIDELNSGVVNWKRMSHGEYTDKERPALEEIALAEACSIHEKELLRKDGSRVPVSFGVAQLKGKPNQGVGFVLDISERRHAEEQFRLAAKVMEYSTKAIVVTNAQNKIIAINRAFTQITGYTSEDLVGKDPNILSSGLHGPEFYQHLWASVNESGHWQGEMLERRKNGDIYSQWLGISIVKNSQGDITHYIAIFSDISERKAAEELVRFQAQHDSLTGLSNRILFDDRLCRAIEHAKRCEARLALLYLDLDGFKYVNDSFGHHVGDKLLQVVSERLMASVRNTDDIICRQGGDEFVILLEGIKKAQDAAMIADDLVKVIEKPFLIENHEITIGVSIGVSICPDDANEFSIMMKHADLAMYEAKHHGKNRYQIFQPECMAQTLPGGGTFTLQ